MTNYCPQRGYPGTTQAGSRYRFALSVRATGSRYRFALPVRATGGLETPRPPRSSGIQPEKKADIIMRELLELFPLLTMSPDAAADHAPSWPNRPDSGPDESGHQ